MENQCNLVLPELYKKSQLTYRDPLLFEPITL